MTLKKRTPEDIIGKLHSAELVLKQGRTTSDARRCLAISEQTYCCRRKEYGSLRSIAAIDGP